MAANARLSKQYHVRQYIYISYLTWFNVPMLRAAAPAGTAASRGCEQPRLPAQLRASARRPVSSKYSVCARLSQEAITRLRSYLLLPVKKRWRCHFRVLHKEQRDSVSCFITTTTNILVRFIYPRSLVPHVFGTLATQPVLSLCDCVTLLSCLCVTIGHTALLKAL